MKYIFFFIIVLIPTIIMADDYDPNNYRPEHSDVNINETNLPIVFIDTRHGSDQPNIIHKDYAIVARMKVIMNNNGINVNKKFIPTNNTFDIGKIYFGIYTLLIKAKFDTTDVIAVFVASLK